MIGRDTSHECIMGSNFFQEHGCQVLYDLGTLHVGDQMLPIFHKNTSPNVCRVILDQDVEIDDGTDVVSATLERGFDQNNADNRVSTECEGDNSWRRCGMLLDRYVRKAVIRLANVSEVQVVVRAGKCTQCGQTFSLSITNVQQ